MISDIKRAENPSMFLPLQVGSFKLSIQASEFHYSRPRLTLPQATDYAAFEVAILENGEWVQPRTDPRFHGMRWVEWFEEYLNPVAAFVPIEVIEQIARDLGSLGT